MEHFDSLLDKLALNLPKEIFGHTLEMIFKKKRNCIHIVIYNTFFLVERERFLIDYRTPLFR